MAKKKTSKVKSKTTAPPSRFRFNPKLGATGRYIDSRGRVVSAKKVIAEAERVIRGTKTEMIDLSRKLKAKKISLQEWHDGMKLRMKIIHGTAASIAKGGWAQMTPADWGAVGSISKSQYQRLNNFTIQIADGLPLDGRFMRRAGMYADAARGTQEDMNRREAARNGLTHERRMLGPADHCTTQKGLKGCVEIADMGWQPIGTLPRIGESPCRTNCHCRFEYGRQGKGGKIIKVNFGPRPDWLVLDQWLQLAQAAA